MYWLPGETEPCCLARAAPNQPREPKEYCQCGSDYATLYSVASTGTNPCPFDASSTGAVITVSTPTRAPSTTAASASSTSSLASSTPMANSTSCNHGWCGSPSCEPPCGPAVRAVSSRAYIWVSMGTLAALFSLTLVFVLFA